MQSFSDSVPENNLKAYCMLFQIEVGLREFIVEEFETQGNSRWWKSRLPSDVLSKYRAGRSTEQSAKWIQLVPHHPIYYIDFPDLKKTIERSDNWRDVFQRTFADQGVFMGTLRELEPIRNKVAHNRKVSDSDIHYVEAAQTMIRTAIGLERFRRLISSCTMAEDIPECLQALQREADQACRSCLLLEPVESLPRWEGTKDVWWFDESYLGHDLEPVVHYFGHMQTYSQLPRLRGMGHKIEQWVGAADTNAKYQRAAEVLAMLIHESGDS